MIGAAGLAVLLTACSSNSSSSTTTTTTSGSSSTDTTSAPTGNGVSVAPGQPINVGAISTLTGSIASDFDGLSPGIQAYFDMVNAEGASTGGS